MVRTSDNGFAIAGYTTSYGAGSRDMLILKLDGNGNLSWARTYGTGYYDEAHCIVQTTDGGYAVAGGIYNYQFVVLKLKANGDTGWARTYYGPQWVGHAYSIVQTTDGGYAATGSISDIYSSDNATPVLRLNSDGDILWSRFYFGMVDGNGVLFDQGNSIIQTADGGFAIAGVTDINLADIPVLMVIKLGWDGGLSWATASSGPQDRGESILQTPDGGLVVAGPAQSLGRVFLIMKMNPGGGLAWSRTLDIYNFDTPSSIIQTMDGGFAVAGDAYNPGGPNRDAVVLKIDGNGNYADCVVDEAPAMVTPEFSTPDYAVASLTWAHTKLSPAIATASSSPPVTDVCIPVPVYESSTEGSSFRGPGILCVPCAGSLLFLAAAETPIRIYFPDGRLAYTGNLQKGENRITLDQGLYIWNAHPYKGKAVVR